MPYHNSLKKKPQDGTNRLKSAFDWEKLLSFLILAFLFLSAFSFGGSQWTYLYEALAFVLALGVLAIVNIPWGSDEKKALLWYSLPVIVFALFSSFSRFWISGGELSTFSSALINAVGILSFYVLGLLFHLLKKIPPESIVYSLLGGLSLLVLISLISSLVSYGPFYAIRYAGQVRYYDALAISISNEWSLLSGFQFASVSLKYGMQFAFLLSASLLGLLFISPKTHKTLFLFVAIAGGIGFLAMALVPYWTGFKLLIPLVIVALIIRFVPFKKIAARWEKRTAITLLALGSLAVILVFVNGVFEISAMNSGFAGKIFDSHYLFSVNEIIHAALTKTVSGVDHLDFLGLFGMNSADASSWNGVSFGAGFFRTNRVFEFTALYEGGLIAFLALVVVFVFAILSFRRLLFKEGKPSGIVFVAFILVFAIVLYGSLSSDCVPFLENPAIYVSPLFRNGLLLLLFFLLGYSYSPIFLKKENDAQIKGGSL